MQSSSMKTSSVTAGDYIHELEAEVRATRECLERIPVDKFDWKPHEKSMILGYLGQLIADMPRWIRYAIEEKEINFMSYPQFKGTTNDELINHFEEGVKAASNALAGVSADRLQENFRLLRGEEVLLESPIGETVGSTINHMVHHRGQLTVYLRLLDIAVPSIYGPSADAGAFDTK